MAVGFAAGIVAAAAACTINYENDPSYVLLSINFACPPI
jgi:hypothetical protein